MLTTFENYPKLRNQQLLIFFDPLLRLEDLNKKVDESNQKVLFFVGAEE